MGQNTRSYEYLVQILAFQSFRNQNGDLKTIFHCSISTIHRAVETAVRREKIKTKEKKDNQISVLECTYPFLHPGICGSASNISLLAIHFKLRERLMDPSGIKQSYSHTAMQLFSHTEKYNTLPALVQMSKSSVRKII